jgi:pilus assembly protein CpaC
MHRKNRRSVWGMLLGLVLGGMLAAGARAQEPPAPQPQPRVGALIVAVNGTQKVTMSTGKFIRTAANSRETVARVQPIPTDPTSVLITGLEPGITRVTLTDVNGAVDAFDVIVQFDIQYLRSVIRRAVPTANVEPIPAANNTVILTGTVTHAEDVDIILRTAQSVVLGPDRVINAMRVGGVQQVQLCVVVAQVARSEVRRMAFDFLQSSPDEFIASTGSGAVLTPGVVGRGSSLLNVGGAISGSPGVPGGAPTNLFFGILQNQSGFLAFLQALRDENLAKIMSEPRLIALSGRPASFLSGGEQAIPVPAGLGQIGVQFEEFGTRLNFIPIVLGDGRIHLEVEPEVSNLDASAGTNIQGTVVPGRVTQRVHTTVELEDGQTFMIGGLIQRETSAIDRKVPCLGDLPFVGAAFRSVSYTERESELVVLVTPHLVDGMACNQLPRLLPGQETRAPDDFELFLEGILEAPRGQRQIGLGRGYQPAYMSGPTAGLFPCAGNGNGGSCNGGGCSTGGGGLANHDDGSYPAGYGSPVVGLSQSVQQSVPRAADEAPASLPAAAPAAGGAEGRVGQR